MKKLLILFVIAGILFGCKKSSTEDEYYTLNGIVIDYDSKIPIDGAKVYAGPLCVGSCPASDSAISDAGGKVSFRIRNTVATLFLSASKANYVRPPIYYAFPIYANGTDTAFLVKPSFVNITTHKTGTFNPLDSIAIRVMGDINSYSFYRDLTRDKADAGDKTFNLSSWYQSPYNVKLYFQWDIIRGGTVISSKSDSTSLIQYGTKNFTINY